MDAFALYLLKSVIWLTGFALVYFLFLRNERFFRLKRYYLITGILISFIFPLFSFHYKLEITAPEMINQGIIPTVTVNVPSVQPVLNDKLFDFRYILLLVYFSGILVLAFRAVRNTGALLKTIYRAKIYYHNKLKLVRAPEFSESFSFLNYVFINPSVDEREKDIIMDHELVHVNQKHWIDLFLVELLRWIQWINPFVWIYTRFIKQNHEYIADEMVLQKTADPAVYRAVLVNQLFDSQVISLSNSFNYSLNKKRFDMMKTIITSPYRKMKILLVLPLFAIVFYAFATPEYHYISDSEKMTENSQAPVIAQKEAKGVVVNEAGKPLSGVNVIVTNSAISVRTDMNGKFAVLRVPEGSSLIFSYQGYKTYILAPLITSNSSLYVKLVKDPDYKEEIKIQTSDGSPVKALVVIDGVVSDIGIGKVDPNSILSMNILKEEAATNKYGEKGKDGVIEITTRKKILEVGLKSAFPRLAPNDYPTFQNQKWTHFREWVIDHINYPSEARAEKIEGWVTVNFTVELDGTISSAVPAGSTDSILSNEVISVIKSSPKWEAPKNQSVDMPFTASVNVGFKYPDQIEKEEPFVVVEEMPMYPGGDAELLKFIAENTKYPEDAKAEKIEGKVIIRFVVNTEGNIEGVSVIKGVHPLIDAEAVRVVSLLSGFKPGMQGGKAVPVWYMVPVNFPPQQTEKP